MRNTDSYPKFSALKPMVVDGREEQCCLTTFSDGAAWLCKIVDGVLAPVKVRNATNSDKAFFDALGHTTIEEQLACDKVNERIEEWRDSTNGL